MLHISTAFYKCIVFVEPFLLGDSPYSFYQVFNDMNELKSLITSVLKILCSTVVVSFIANFFESLFHDFDWP